MVCSVYKATNTLAVVCWYVATCHVTQFSDDRINLGDLKEESVLQMKYQLRVNIKTIWLKRKWVGIAR